MDGRKLHQAKGRSKRIPRQPVLCQVEVFLGQTDRFICGIDSAPFAVLQANNGNNLLSNLSSVLRTRSLLNFVVPLLSVSFLGLPCPLR